MKKRILMIAASVIVAGGFAAVLLAACASASAGGTMSSGTTPANLYAAYRGEITAQAMYRDFAELADDEGQPLIARFYRALAQAEFYHGEGFRKLAESLGLIIRENVAPLPYELGYVRENLLETIANETAEFADLYRGFYNRAMKDSTQAVAEMILRTSLVEKNHAETALALFDILNGEGNFSQLAGVYLCPVCGAVEFNLPDRCVVCGGERRLFIQY